MKNPPGTHLLTESAGRGQHCHARVCVWLCVYWVGAGGYLHAAVSEGNRVCVAGHALLLAVVGAGGRSHGVTRVDVVRVDGLSTGRLPGTTQGLYSFSARVLLWIYHHRPAGFGAFPG